MNDLSLSTVESQSVIWPRDQVEQMKLLYREIPQNELGLLSGFYRPDMLPSFLTPTTTTLSHDSEIKVAFTYLDYAEGYPTINGNPFWLQHDFEPDDAYHCFNKYLEQGKIGLRQLNLLEVDMPLPILMQMATLYYWHDRAKAYDKFYGLFRQRKRERQLLETEDTHFEIGSKLIAVCSEYLNENLDELKETMTPSAFTKLLTTGVSVQRIALGLPAGGPAKETVSQKTTTVTETQTQEIMQQQEAEQQNLLAHIRSNPEMLEMAQRLILTASQKRTVTQTTVIEHAPVDED